MFETDDFYSPKQFPFVNAFGADFLHFTISATLKNDEMRAWAGGQAAQPVNYRLSFLSDFFFCLDKKGFICGK